MTRLRICKLNESAHLSYFYALSVFWAVYNIFTENLLPSLSGLWEGYPHSAIPFWTKLFLIGQELIHGRIVQVLLHLFLIAAAYVGGLAKLCLVLVSLHYAADIFLHVSRVLYLADIKKAAWFGFTIWNALFIPVRMISTILAFLTLQFTVMIVFFIAQAFMVWNFIIFHQKRLRKNRGLSPLSRDSKRKEKKKGKQDEDAGSDAAIDSDQSNRKEAYRRRPVKARP